MLLDWLVYVKPVCAFCLFLAPDCAVNFPGCDINFLLLESNAIKLNCLAVYQRTVLIKY